MCAGQAAVGSADSRNGTRWMMGISVEVVVGAWGRGICIAGGSGGSGSRSITELSGTTAVLRQIPHVWCWAGGEKTVWHSKHSRASESGMVQEGSLEVAVGKWRIDMVVPCDGVEESQQDGPRQVGKVHADLASGMSRHRSLRPGDCCLKARDQCRNGM